MTVSTSETPGYSLVAAAGELDAYTVPSLGEAISGLIREDT